MRSARRAAILCPGPSLFRLTDRPDDCELVIGVNRAATVHVCDAWAGCDLPMILDHGTSVIGSPLLLADDATIGELHRRDANWRGATFDRGRLSGFCPESLEWRLFSATTALVYAAFTGAQRIEVFGADWHGTADFDGQQAGKNRSPARWELERAIWEKRLVPWLAEQAITVHRV